MIVPLVGIITLALMIVALIALSKRARYGIKIEDLTIAEESYPAKSTEELLEILQKGKAEEKVLAIEDLIKLRPPGIGILLVEAMGEKNEQVRLAAKAALTEIKDPTTVPLLIEAMKDPDRWLPARVAEVLLAIGTPAIPHLEEAYKGQDDTVRAYALQILGMVNLEACVPLVSEALKDSAVEVRRVAAAVVAENNPPQLMNAMLEAAKDSDPKVRLQAVKALGATNGAEAVDSLEEAARDEDWGVAATAMGALNRLGERGQQVLRKIASDCGHPANEQAVALVGKQSIVPKGVAINISFGSEE